MSAEAANDVERLNAILDTVKKRGLRIAMLSFGDVKIQLFEPWPAAKDAPAKVLVKDDEDPKLGPLRKKCRDLFGHVKSDAELLQAHEDGLL